MKLNILLLLVASYKFFHQKMVENRHFYSKWLEHMLLMTS